MSAGAARRVLVTGATSGLGMELVRALRARGDEVVAFVRPTSATDGLFRLACRMAEGDVTDAASVLRAARGCDAVVHAAARVGDVGRRAEFVRVNVQGTENVLRAAADAGVRRVVHVSTSAVYGDAPEAEVTEATALRPTGLAYPDSKLEAERAVFAAAVNTGTAVTVVRPAPIYGPHDRTFVPRLAALLRAGTFVYVADPATPVNVTHVAHVVDVIARALDAPGAVGEAFNVCDDDAFTLGELVAVACRSLRVAPPRLRLPPRVAGLAAVALEGAYALARREGPPPLTRYALQILARGYRLSSAKARAVLDWAPTVRTAEGIAQACERLG